MKIKDTRDGRVMEGALVHTIEAGREATIDEMHKFYRMNFNHRNYAITSKAQPYDRLVLQHGEADDMHYLIVPKYPFYEVQEG